MQRIFESCKIALVRDNKKKFSSVFINDMRNENSPAFFRDRNGKYKSDKANYLKLQSLSPDSRGTCDIRRKLTDKIPRCIYVFQ